VDWFIGNADETETLIKLSVRDHTITMLHLREENTDITGADADGAADPSEI
jgi:hypothetical protein